MTEVKLEYFESVTQNVNGLAITKKLLFDDLKELKEHYEKQEKHLKQFKKNMNKLEESSQSLKVSIEEKRKIEAVKQDKYLKEIEQAKIKITELQDLNKQYESQYKKNTYKLNNSIFTLEQKKKQMDERLNSLYADKDELAEKLNKLLDKANQEKQQSRDQLDQVQNKIQEFKNAIAQQEAEDSEEEQMVQELKKMSEQEQQQAKQAVQQINKATQNNQKQLKLAIKQIEENITIVQTNIQNLNKAISDQKNINQSLQIQLKQITEKINIKIDVYVQQKEQLTRQVNNFELDAAQQMDKFTFQFNQITNEKQQHHAHLDKLKQTRKFINEQDQEFKNQIQIFEQQQQAQRLKLQTQIEELTQKENSLKLQFETEKKQLKEAQEKLIVRHTELSKNYEHHCNEILTLRQSYETTITNINIKIKESTTIIHNYEVEVQKHQSVAQEFRPPHFVVQKNKGKYIAKVEEGEEEEEDVDDDESASESDDEHFNVIVNFLTKDKIKSSKKKIKIELVNGIYYLTFNGYIKKAEKDKNIILDTRKNAEKNFNFSYKVKLFDEIDQNSHERLSIKDNKVHKLKISKKKGTKITLKVSRTPLGAIHKAVGHNQHFYGTYENNGRTVPMALSGVNIEEDGRIHGKGSDVEGGEFTLEGLLDTKTNNVKFIKKYTSGTPAVEYNGVYAKKSIKGRWSIGLYNAPFIITSTQKVYSYAGWFDQDGQKTDMSFILMLKQGDEVEGEGMDEVGAFKWKGTIEEKGKAELVKQYIGQHSVNYKGLKKGKKITGIWEVQGYTGNFEVVEQSL